MAKARKFQQFDPRPPALRYTSQKSVNDFLTSCQALNDESNWSSIPPHYEDYELSSDRKLEIVSQSAIFMNNMKSVCNRGDTILRHGGLHSDLDALYAQDPLTTPDGYHITGTVEQSIVMQIDTFYFQIFKKFLKNSVIQNKH